MAAAVTTVVAILVDFLRLATAALAAVLTDVAFFLRLLTGIVAAESSNKVAAEYSVVKSAVWLL